MKIIINDCFGGFDLSIKAVKEYAKLKGFTVSAYIDNREGSLQNKIFIKATKKDENKNEVFHFCKSVKQKIGAEELDEKYFIFRNIPRNDKDLVKVVNKLKSKANTYVSKLKIVNIPDGVDWIITEYDGLETIEEKHRTWR